MKKSKAIKLVLITGLMAPGGKSFAGWMHPRTMPATLTIESGTEKKFSGNGISRYGYFTQQDSGKRSSGTGGEAHMIATRGGFGFWGSHGFARS